MRKWTRRPCRPHLARFGALTTLCLSLTTGALAQSAAPLPTPAPTSAAAPAAQPAAPAAAPAAQGDRRSEAQRLFEDGVAALRAGNAKGAADMLNRSYALEQQAVTLYNLGIAYQSLRSPALAVEAWEAYAAMADPKKEGETIAAVRREIARVTGLMARYALKVEPADAQILIDGKPVRRFKEEIWVDPGSHHISVKAPGYEDFDESLVVEAGHYSLDIKLRRPQGSPQVVAERLLSEGEQLVAQGNVAAGVEKLEQAHRLAPTPQTAGALGLAAENLGRLGHAQEMVELALEERSHPWVKKNKRKLRIARRRLAGKAATLIIGGEYPGADVEVNGREVGELPLPGGGQMKVAEGPVTVKAHLPGYDSFSVELDARAQTEINVTVLMYKTKPRPVTVVLIPHGEWPNPPPPLPKTPPQAPKAIAEGPKQEDPEGANQADIEALSTAYEGEPPPEFKEVVGMEMQLDFGYQMWLGDGLSESNGGFASRLFGFGYRPYWLVSFGVQLVGGTLDMPGDERQVVSTMTVAGLYLRLHTQVYRKPMTPDFYFGVGYQPVSMGLTVYEAQKLAVSDLNPDTDANDLVQNQLGVGDTVTYQTWNLPLEAGFAWYFTDAFAVTLNAQFNLWNPIQECFHDSSDRICYDDKLDSFKSLYFGGGFAFLP